MRKKLSVKSTQRLFDNLKSDALFTCDEKYYGLKVKYNDIFTSFVSPKINIYRLSENEVEIKISSNPLMLILSLIITIAFWAIAFYASYINTDKIAVVIIALIAPLFIWIYDIFFMNRISKIILPEIESRQ